MYSYRHIYIYVCVCIAVNIFCVHIYICVYTYTYLTGPRRSVRQRPVEHTGCLTLRRTSTKRRALVSLGRLSAATTRKPWAHAGPIKHFM